MADSRLPSSPARLRGDLDALAASLKILAAPPERQRSYAGMLRHAAILQFESSAAPAKILEGLAERSLLSASLRAAISAVDEAVFALYQAHASPGFERAILTNSPAWCAVRASALAALQALREQRSRD